MRRAAAVALAVVVVTPSTQAACPNNCSHNGKCGHDNECQCFSGWEGGDCSLRSCPSSTAWADVPDGNEWAHQEAVCSNRGLCNHSTGHCDCQEGFTGKACERIMCPETCGGVGQCMSMRRASTYTADTGPLVRYTGWDADKMWGCVCDEDYEGYSCSRRACPRNQDPLRDTAVETPEVQLFRCDYAPDSGFEFTLTFRGQTTGVLNSGSYGWDLHGELSRLSTIRNAEVIYYSEDDAATTFCAGDGSVGSSNNVVYVRFNGEPGNVPPLLVKDASGADLQGMDDNMWAQAMDGEALDRAGDSEVFTSVAGTTLEVECSRRGMCNRKSGECACVEGFQASTYWHAEGVNGDCGYMEVATTSCPGFPVECNGKGRCSGAPHYQCTCEVGHGGADCSERTCPTGRTWFGLPVDESADAHLQQVECSGVGDCDEVRHRCKCRTGFEGEACERLTCPGKTSPHGVCSGHGACLPMRALGDYAVDAEGASTPYTYGFTPNDGEAWDYEMIQGCLCDEGWTGYDCSLMTCPTGDDVTTDTPASEVQELTCKLLTSSAMPHFRLKYGKQVTEQLPYDATAADVKAAIEGLSGVDTTVTVEYNAGDSFCGTLPVTATITFDDEKDRLPLGIRGTSKTALSVSKNAHTVTQGSTEDAECNKRGICDRTTGQCQCFTGFGSSDGSGGPGRRGDCGHRRTDPYEQKHRQRQRAQAPNGARLRARISQVKAEQDQWP